MFNLNLKKQEPRRRILSRWVLPKEESHPEQESRDNHPTNFESQDSWKIK